ncbi:hypothetical protein C1147_02475 [Clostridium botulinum]|nr:hypothetical protein C1147_02475 [Clostridium botulinum]
MFLEMKELLQKSTYEYAWIGVSLANIYFDDFKILLDRSMEEITLKLFLDKKEVAFLNIERNDSFYFQFDEGYIDFRKIN